MLDILGPGPGMLDLMLELPEGPMGLAYLFISRDIAVIERTWATMSPSCAARAHRRDQRTRRVFEHPAEAYTRALMAAVLRDQPDPRAAASTG